MLNTFTKTALHVFIVVFMILTLAGCEPEVVPPPPVKKETKLTLDFRLKWEGKEAFIQIGEYTNKFGEVLQVVNLSQMISDMALEREDGTWLVLGDGFQHFNIWGARTKFDYAIPAGKYKGLKLKMGLDYDINHGDPAAWPTTHPLSTNVTSLHWGWAGGYIFQALDGRWKKTGDADFTKTFSFHTATDNFVRNFSMAYPATGSEVYFELKDGQQLVLPLEYHLDQVLGNREMAAGSVSHSSGTNEVKLMQSLLDDMTNNKAFRLGIVE
jgi:hypothetical protein